MHFAQPNILWLLLILPLLLFLLRLGMHRKSVFLECLGDPALLRQTPSRFPTLHRTWVRSLLLVFPVLSLILALADPRIPHGSLRLRPDTLDTVLLIDVSKSMLAEDYHQSSRLDKAREIIRHLLSDLQGNRVGIVTFAGSSFRQADLSEDVHALDFIVEHWVNPDAAGVGGSNLVRALEAGLTLFSNHHMREKLILLFSDGGEVESDMQAILARAKHRQIKILTFGLGSMQPSRIPLYDTQHRFTGYVELDGKVVTTHLNEAPLKRIATATNGTYQRVSRREVWPTLLTQGSIVSNLLARNEKKVFQPFLLAGLLVCGAQTLITRL